MVTTHTDRTRKQRRRRNTTLRARPAACTAGCKGKAMISGNTLNPLMPELGSQGSQNKMGRPKAVGKDTRKGGF